MKRLGWGILSVAVLAGVLFGLFYHHIQAGLWRKERAAAAIAVQRTGLSKVNHVTYFAGHKVYYVVRGTDAKGRQMLVWVTGRTAHAAYADQGVSQAQAEKIWRRRHADAKLIRIVPGVDNGIYAWEIFYKQKDADGTYYYYDYYRFANGAKIDTYRLNQA